MGKQASAAERQSAAAEEALSASIQPLIADVPPGTLQRLPNKRMGWLFGAEDVGAGGDVDVSRILVGGDDADDSAYLRVPVRNIGAGVARILAAIVTFARNDAIGEPLVPEMPTVVAPAEVAFLFFSSSAEPQPGSLKRLTESDEVLVVEIAYTDVAGRQEAASQILIKKERDDRFHVGGVRPLVPRKYTA